MSDFTKTLCSVERDRMTAAEICIDEILTIMDRHGEEGLLYETLLSVSRELQGRLTEADGVRDRRNRMIRVRSALTEAFPMTDDDLAKGDVQLSV